MSAQRLQAGQYEVVFNHSINKCVSTATTGLSGSDGTPGAVMVTLAKRFNSDAGIFVETWAPGGSNVDSGFTLNVRC